MKVLRTPQQWAHFIHHRCMPLKGPLFTKVVYRSGEVYYGYFQACDDYLQLKAQKQFRFVPIENVRAFRSRFHTTGHFHKRLTLVLDCRLIRLVSIGHACV